MNKLTARSIHFVNSADRIFTRGRLLRSGLIVVSLIGTTLVTELRAATLTSIATDDAYITEQAPTSVVDAGSLAARLNASSGSSFRHEMAVLRFDISALSGNMVNSATLNLVGNATTSNSAQYNLLGVFQANSNIAGMPWDDDWTGSPDANSITFDNAPFIYHGAQDGGFETSGYIYDRWDLVPDGETTTANMIAQELVGSATTIGLTTSADLDVAFTFNSTAEFVSFLQTAANNGDSFVTLLMPSRSGSLYSAKSTEGAGANNSLKPTLVVEYVPEPGAIVLGMIGFIAVVGARRYVRQ
jgi:hypothetical protein